jgi:hypothetical protein
MGWLRHCLEYILVAAVQMLQAAAILHDGCSSSLLYERPRYKLVLYNSALKYGMSFAKNNFPYLIFSEWGASFVKPLTLAPGLVTLSGRVVDDPA